MPYVNGVYYYKGLLDDLDKLTKFDAIKNLINPPLSDDQSIDLLRALAVKRFAAIYGTGLGKTFLATAFTVALMNKDPSTKVLFFAKKSQEEQTPKKISSISGLKCNFMDSSSTTKIDESLVRHTDMLILTHDCLYNPRIMNELLVWIDSFDAIIIDEAHLLTNLEGASSSFCLYALCHEVEYVLALTATPVTTNIEQLPRLLKILNPDMIDDYKRLTKSIKLFGLESLEQKYKDMFVVRERPFNNHKGIRLFVKPMRHQVGAKGKNLFVITKGPGAYEQAHTVLDYVIKNRPLHGLIYANLDTVKKFLCDYLNKHGVNAAIADGKTTATETENLTKSLAKGELDVLITNKKESLDMDASYVIFYEFTPHVKQVIGRGERGLNPKKMEIVYLITEDTDEEDYFMRNVYEISQDIQELLNLDNSEVVYSKRVYND